MTGSPQCADSARIQCPLLQNSVNQVKSVMDDADKLKDRCEIFGVCIHALRMHQVLEVVHSAIADRRKLRIGVLNAAKLVKMQRDHSLAESVSSSNLILADGNSLVWASKILGDPLPERVAGIDIMLGMLEQGNRHGYRFFLLGATDEVSLEVERQIRKRFPGAVIAGRHHGFFSEEEEVDVANMIKTSSADILLVAISSPYKERFMAKWNNTIDVPIVHGVGGSFDVMAGKVQRAPLAWQKIGLEWLYRVIQEPRRLFWRYLSTNTVFLTMLFKEWVKKRLLS